VHIPETNKNSLAGNYTSYFIAFLSGGVITLIILLCLEYYAKMMLGMSAGPVRPPPMPDWVVNSIICGYFFISAFGVFKPNTLFELRFWAAVSHILLLTIFVAAICSKHSGILVIYIFVYYSPWVITWAYLLKKAKEDCGRKHTQ